ncbi:hypothetical protein DH2020_034219 [Rehmannia glutinosa]|uniref:Uncharacterized protein n=1 Tax=Rehmannia glutinosa TaxID=99300 RepID=A0ABR0VA18_REHGL
MESGGTSGMAKRMKVSVCLLLFCSSRQYYGETDTKGEENEPSASNSEQVEIEIAHVLEKINNFTQMVSELLESGKSMLKELSNDFEERMILLHKEQMEKWQEEIKELRTLDAANEDIDALLQNAKYLLQNIHGGS